VAEPSVLVEKSPRGVATLVFNRPGKLNSFSADLVSEATAALAELREDPAVRSVIVRGNGRAFSAGFDLGTARPEAENTPSAKLRRWKFGREASGNFLRSFWEFPKPVVAAVHGYCLGGACELALLCDLTVAAESCKLGEPEIRQATSSSMSVLLALYVPPKIATEILLGGGLMTAARAYEVGLVNQVVPDEELLEAADKRASLLALLDPQAVTLAKESIRFALETAGALQAVRHNSNLNAILAGLELERDEEYERTRATDGLGAALKARRQKFAEFE
jgi:enoyl-CoA hydratase/carnithine racemase